MTVNKGDSMNFQVNADEFKEAIIPAVEVATRNALKEFPYENRLTIKVKDDKVIIFAYSGIASMISPVPGSNFGSLDYKCTEEGQTTVYADEFLQAFTSLPPGERVEVALKKGELVVTPLSSKDLKRSMFIFEEVVQPPNLGKESSQEIKINREIFVKGLNSVMFAPAFEEKYHSYMCVLFETGGTKGKQNVRFSAGTGGRFAVKSIDGKNILNTAKMTKFIFPKTNLESIQKVLSGASCSEITMKTIDADASQHIPDQIMIEFDGMVMCLFGLEYFTKYPDLTKIINHKYSNRIYSNLKDWRIAVGGVDMTWLHHGEDVHNTEVVFESEKERFMVKPEATHGCPTPIDIVDNQDCIVKGDKIWFRCNSEYLKEMVSHGSREGKIQFNFESQSILEEESDPGNKPKQMRPVLVKFPEVVDGIKEIKENFHMFFTVSSK